jgi:hypothetical protein
MGGDSLPRSLPVRRLHFVSFVCFVGTIHCIVGAVANAGFSAAISSVGREAISAYMRFERLGSGNFVLHLLRAFFALN